MSTIKSFPNGTFQLRVTHKLLEKPVYATFDKREEAEAYGLQLDGLLAQGVVPKSFLERGGKGEEIWTVSRCIAEYIKANSVPVSDVKLLTTLKPLLASVKTAMLNYDWAEAWVRQMKRTLNLAPSTIRHRHGALARCFDWMVRKHPGIMAQNPLRLLKRGFATYTDEDTKLVVAAGMESKIELERDRRLAEDEELAILQVLKDMPDENAFFVLALESAMRMRECYTLYENQVSLKKKTIHLDRTKNGDSRQVPLTSTAMNLLKHYIEKNSAVIQQRGGILFPFWNGDPDEYVLDTTTSDVSKIFRNAFAEAKVSDLHFHDLRHEATCRLYEKTTLSDVLIAKITGHRNLRMLIRYASLRGSDLAGRLW